MNVLSLFDGISCGRIALSRAGININNYYASEIDKYAIKISRKNYPDIIQLGDIQNWKSWALDWSKIDLLIGGSPCQGFSFAGKQLNFNDPRSALFFVYVDILNHIKTVNPNVKFLLENVQMKKEYIQIISKYLEVDPIFINSNIISAANRPRIYWANFNNPLNLVKKNIFFQDIMDKNAPQNHYYSHKALAWIRSRELSTGKKIKELNSPNTKVPCLEASMYKNYSTQRFYQVTDKNGPRYLSLLECERCQTIPDNYTLGVSNTQRYKMLGNSWTVDVIAHLFKGIK